ncbi:MarR family winged helix-turn-helix transcriptional regulator [Flavimaricola marinus]|uniref:MarR family protein n=1 Tax=Flavimaricola marinus TaxID=1819565 RepID=A0A238LJW7_9RHOB|nr:MarR family transcriptional regulator [Flavimaricola marinus]SMY09918.1 MarR family protein [Flavimaricola marinus]
MSDFDLRDFLPYVLNMAAEQSSIEFQKLYKDRYGMLRTEWRVLFHLGRYGTLTAKEICDRANMHKTKVSRAVARLESRRFIARQEVEEDRRHERLDLTKAGQAAYADLSAAAQAFDAKLAAQFSPEEEAILRRCLTRLAALPKV